MKILFVHLSDIHMKAQFQVNSTKNTKLIEAIRSNFPNVDRCVLICTGDITNKAHINEYRVASKFFGKILSELGKSIDDFINLLIVPGNHDLDLSFEERDFNQINQYYKNGSAINEYKKELERNKNFLSYAKRKNCFRESDIISKNILTYGETKIQINLINTSPFSTKEHNDKELHYLPSSEMLKLKRDADIEVVISIMHHSSEWFHQESKMELETLLYENSDILFLGHDHIAVTENVKNKNSCDIHISRGGEYSGLYSISSSFLTLEYDTKSKRYIEKTYSWNPLSSVFAEHNENKQALKVGNSSFCNNQDFTKLFYEDSQGLKSSCLDYFVFPMLKVRSNEYEKSSDYKVVNKEEFMKAIEKCNIVHITAPEDCGKSTLLKFLYNHYREVGCVPLYFSEESYHNRIDRIIEYLFNDQYMHQSDQFAKYKQMNISKRIILIDNIDKLRSNTERNRLLDYFKENFDTVIFTSSKTDNVDVLSAIEEAFESKYKIKTFELESFYYRKRNALIENVCKSFGVTDEASMQSIVELMNNLINKNYDLFELSPSTLIHYVKYFASQDDETRKKDVVFYEVFRNNIINLLRENISDIDIDEYLMQLEELADYMHFNKKPVINSNELNECFKRYDKTWGSTITKSEMISNLVKCKIISNGSQLNHYRFSNNNYFDYFVARKINREINNGTNYDKVFYLTKNICFTINDKVLMFLAEIRSNTSFVLNLCDQLNEMMEPYIEIDFDTLNISLFNRMDYKDIHIATPEEKNRIEEKIEHDEINEATEAYDEIGFIKQYDYEEKDINNFENTLHRAYKYMEMISKSYASQFSILKKEEKEKIARVIMKIPNKLVYAMLKPLDDKYDQIVDATYQMVLSLDIKDIKKTDVEDKVVDLARAMTLGLFDSISYDCTTKKTMRYMDNIDCVSISNKIKNLMMIGFSRGTNAFLDESIKLINEYPDNVVMQTFVRLIVRVHIIRNKKINYKQIEKISKKIFYIRNKEEIFRLLMIE